MTTAMTAWQLTRPAAVLFPYPETYRQEFVVFAGPPPSSASPSLHRAPPAISRKKIKILP